MFFIINNIFYDGVKCCLLYLLAEIGMVDGFFFFFDVAVYAKCCMFFSFLKQNVLLCSSTNKLQYGLSHGYDKICSIAC